jgi:hypothetical protein
MGSLRWRHPEGDARHVAGNRGRAQEQMLKGRRSRDLTARQVPRSAPAALREPRNWYHVRDQKRHATQHEQSVERPDPAGGVDDLAIQRILRHGDVSTTRRCYIKTLPEQSVAAMKKLEALINQVGLICNQSATEPAKVDLVN